MDIVELGLPRFRRLIGSLGRTRTATGVNPTGF